MRFFVIVLMILLCRVKFGGFFNWCDDGSVELPKILNVYLGSLSRITLGFVRHENNSAIMRATVGKLTPHRLLGQFGARMCLEEFDR